MVVWINSNKVFIERLPIEQIFSRRFRLKLVAQSWNLLVASKQPLVVNSAPMRKKVKSQIQTDSRRIRMWVTKAMRATKGMRGTRAKSKGKKKGKARVKGRKTGK